MSWEQKWNPQVISDSQCEEISFIFDFNSLSFMKLLDRSWKWNFMTKTQTLMTFWAGNDDYAQMLIVIILPILCDGV